MKKLFLSSLILLSFTFISCNKDTDNNDTNSGTASGETTTTVDSTSTASLDTGLQALLNQFYNGANIYVEGDYIYIEVAGTPDHNSPYWGSGHSKYEAYNGSNADFFLNPNKIGTMNYTFKIPKNPAVDANHAATPMGPIGVAINGVAFYNQNAAPGDDLSQEINSFDQYNGHPTGQSSYHYHIEPTYLTKIKATESSFMGFLLDGFPVYGPVDHDGTRLTSSDLDDYHGHFGPTPEFPNGIYHYHITDDDPYINGDGFYGSAGTVTQ